jgi:hypothetical protein
MNIFRDSFTVSKRLLGALMLTGGAGGLIGLLALDVIRGTLESGFGPVQQAAMGACAVLAVVGLTLLPLGKRPA